MLHFAGEGKDLVFQARSKVAAACSPSLTKTLCDAALFQHFLARARLAASFPAGPGGDHPHLAVLVHNPDLRVSSPPVSLVS